MRSDGYGFFVKNMAAMIRFYRDALGFTIQETEGTDREGKVLTPLVHTILKAIALAMGVSVAVLSVLTELDVHFGMSMLGIGLAFLAMTSLEEKGKA